MPGLATHFERGTFPAELATRFGAMGLLGPSLTGYGCAAAAAATRTTMRRDIA